MILIMLRLPVCNLAGDFALEATHAANNVRFLVVNVNSQ